ncbi:leucine-rich repeat and WD repeat-containing protein 1-like [Thrips palmi]|uniref:Leucine-rich repeat and WD repeat-containing protein 1-like n=1 Tax=Thrips palmi TaxID=161013 RepID=A0A6P9AE32_THRPL|nr:leucine-rich repeat and WD repeat-containing protein 1-like [Thrips palmi]XP_034255634.1 leucine-rich repeat and WD repeat-containing protein 1-like [Thrips palmi]
MEETEEYYSDPRFEYEPATFLKCHSKIRGDKNDRNTKVWACAFEPHPDYPEKTTDLIATCAANSICVIDVKKECMVTKHYAKQAREEFYSVSWSTLFMKDTNKKTIASNILAAAGAQCIVHLIHPCHQVCFFEEKIKMPSKVTITSVQFHPLARTVLCGGFSSGDVYIWDIGQPSFPDYEMKFTCLHKLSIDSEIFTMSFSRHCRTLLAATENGVAAWGLDLSDVNVSTVLKAPKTTNDRIKMWRFNFPLKPGLSSKDYQLVDTVEPIQTGKMIASKCALYGNIYLWDLEEAMQYAEAGGNVKVEPAHTLNYSKTDNYFMSMGSSLMSGLLTCGDDLGNIWLYDLKEVLTLSHKVQQESAVIPWPIVNDVHDQWMVEQKEVVVNKVVVNYNGTYIVAVTNTNLVCIWKKEKGSRRDM